MDEARSDAEIVARTYLHPELFGLLFDRHFATVYRYLERRVGRDDADELSGEVFRIAFEQRARFRPCTRAHSPGSTGSPRTCSSSTGVASLGTCTPSPGFAVKLRTWTQSSTPSNAASPRAPQAPRCLRPSGSFPHGTATCSSSSPGRSS